MIISQTPLRVSLFGGGTDFHGFYSRHSGAVLSLAIDKYIYVIVKERFDTKIYINYSHKEIVDHPNEIKHDLIREALIMVGIKDSIEITILADVPSEGSGLGSSSSLLVGLLNALYSYIGSQVSQERLAQEACKIEIDILGRPIGIQDQYIAAFGNLRLFEFEKNGSVGVSSLDISEENKREFISNLMLFYTNTTRQSSSILKEQSDNIESNHVKLLKLKDMVYLAKKLIVSNNTFTIGKLLHDSWLYKKILSTGITNDELDNMLKVGMDAGALGGKISGAGGGGFLLLYCTKQRQQEVRSALKGYRELPFMLSRHGSSIIFKMIGYEWK